MSSRIHIYLVGFTIMLLAVFSGCVTTCGCSPAEEPPPNIESLDLSGAVGLIVTDNGIGISGLLYKVTEEGAVMIVDVLNKSGEIVNSKISSFDLLNINEDFILLGISRESEHHYLINKKTGLAYRVFPGGKYPALLVPTSPFSCPDLRCYQTDGEGNIFFKSWDDRIGRLDPSQFGESKLEPEEIMTSDQVEQWGVPADGSFVAYSGKGPEDEDVYRVVTIDGRVTDLNALIDGTFLSGFFRGRDGNLYGAVNPEDSNLGSIDKDLEVFRISVSADGDAEIEFVGVLSEREQDYPNDQGSSPNWPIASPGLGHRVGDKLLFLPSLDLDPEMFGPGQVLEMDLPNAKIRLVNNVDNTLELIIDSGATDTFYYLYGIEGTTGQTAIYRVDPATDELLRYDVADEFEIYEFNVLRDGKVLLYAFSFAIGANIIAEIDMNGEITILDGLINEPISIMQPI